ncbi:MAG TPA: hypothetical protein VJ608_04700 [Albitalea sp.]|nr:hypothetical protein [Albitalea sp.]
MPTPANTASSSSSESFAQNTTGRSIRRISPSTSNCQGARRPVVARRKPVQWCLASSATLAVFDAQVELHLRMFGRWPLTGSKGDIWPVAEL